MRSVSIDPGLGPAVTRDLSPDPRVISGVVSSEVDLVLQARGGDLDAFALLVARYRDRFVRYARHMIGSHEDAEEVVQDAFVRVHRALARCDPERFGAWSFRIMVNRCRSAARRRHWWRVRSADLQHATEVGVPHPAGRMAWREEIDRAVARLTSDQREAFLLKHVEELSYQEMSLVTGASVAALKMRVSRACEQLRGLLGDLA